MKRTLTHSTILAVLLCGIVSASESVLDGFDFSQENLHADCEILAPAKIIPSEKTEDDSLVRPGDIPIRPPKLVQTETGQLVLVQYTARNHHSGTPTQANTQATNPSPVLDIPQHYRDFNSMGEAERLNSVKRSIESVMTANLRRGMNTQSNTPNEIMLMSLPYGADAKVFQPNPHFDPRDRNANATSRGNNIYSIGVLCWNTPAGGKTMLRTDGVKVIARVGHGYQNRPASFAAMLAMSNIMPNYEIRVNNASYTIAHLIASEKLALSKGMNMSMALVALSFYGESNEQWRSELGDVWSIEQMVMNELNRQIDQGTSDVTDWLLGLTAAVNLYESENRPIRGPMVLAKRQLKTYQDFVLSIQNDRYLWHPKFFLYKGFNPDAFETMYSGGHILRWLVYSLPDNELRDPQIVRAVMSLAATVNRVKPETMASSLNTKQLEGLAVSLHALSLYYQRAFGAIPLDGQGQQIALR